VSFRYCRAAAAIYFALVSIVGLLPLPASAGVSPGLVRPPYLQIGTPTSMVVRWRTDVTSDTRLSYGPAPDDLSTTLSDPALVTEHEVAIPSLEPGTRYYYGVGTDAEIIAGGDADHYFETSPAAGSRQPVRIWVIGDSGECSFSAQGCIDAGAVRDEYLAHAQETGGIANAWLMLGDNAYTEGTDTEHTVGVFEVYPEIMRNTPLWPVPGNHEYKTDGAVPYYEAFTLPTEGQAGGEASGSESYYSFDFGNVHFVALDSHGTDRSTTGAMYQWLEADLEATSAEWLIAFWHHPPYTNGSHDSDNEYDSGGRLWDMRMIFLPLLESHGVDLQLTGHSHSYERSLLLDGHYGTSDTFDPAEHAFDTGDGDPAGHGAYAKDAMGLEPNMGAVYSVVGSSSKNSGVDSHPVMKRSISYEGSMLVDIDGAALEAVFIDKDGDTRDRFRIEKVPEPAATTTQLAGLALLSLMHHWRASRRCALAAARPSIP